MGRSIPLLLMALSLKLKPEDQKRYQGKYIVCISLKVTGFRKLIITSGVEKELTEK